MYFRRSRLPALNGRPSIERHEKFELCSIFVSGSSWHELTSKKIVPHVGRVINAPIFHVNSDDPDNVVYTSEVASEWRQTFRRDVVIDIVGYRKHGHQEVDDPHFTQPVLYKKIKSMKTCFELYTEKLTKENIVTAEEVKKIKEEYENILEKDFAKVKELKVFKIKEWLDSPWSAFFEGIDQNKMMFEPGIHEDTIVHIAKMVSSLPPDSAKFVIHKGLHRVLNNRAEMAKNRQVDFAMAESIAFGSLLKQGVHVRITGEDSERGTFSHRHHVYHHQEIENETYNPILHLYPDQAKYTVCNSCLSEYGILGFEHGYSMVNPNSLVIWEAQFGDFANTAQVITDQFLSSGESKWARQCGMVMYLPHGMEGQGPEHSSTRPERFADMISEDAEVMPPENTPNFALDQLRSINWIVANCSTPANHFHILRRQIALPFRKPLILLTPKGILRHPEARSSFDLMLKGTEFQRLIPTTCPAGEGVEKLIFCTGKVFYEADKVIKENKLESKIAVSRIEQIGPFPFDLVQKEIQKFPQAPIYWLQEEHKNQGFWDHIEPRIRTILRNLDDKRDVCYIGREVSASPASGYKYQYQQQLKKLRADIIKIE